MLLGNFSVLSKMPLRYFGGSTSSAEVQVRSNFGASGPNRNRFYVDQRATALKLYAVPTGMYVGKAWILPQKQGEMSSHNDAAISIAPAGLAYGGITTTGTASISINFANATGGLISSGSGAAYLSISTNAPALTGTLSAAGLATMVLDAQATARGLASISGGAGWVMTGAGAMLPTNDASPLRTGVASFAITGSLTPYAIGNMVGSTIDNTGLTSASISAAVWAAATRTLTSSSGSTPTTEDITTAIMAALNAATIPVDMRKVKGQVIGGTGSAVDPWGPS